MSRGSCGDDAGVPVGVRGGRGVHEPHGHLQGPRAGISLGDADQRVCRKARRMGRVLHRRPVPAVFRRGAAARARRRVARRLGRCSRDSAAEGIEGEDQEPRVAHHGSRSGREDESAPSEGRAVRPGLGEGRGRRRGALRLRRGHLHPVQPGAHLQAGLWPSSGGQRARKVEPDGGRWSRGIRQGLRGDRGAQGKPAAKP